MTDALWATPLPGVLLTMVAFQAARALQQRGGGHPLLNPVAVSALGIIAALLLTKTSYDRYVASARVLLWLLGPATVALAVPLARELPRLARVAWPLIVAVAVGAATSVLSAVTLARLMGADAALARALAPKSATTPIALGIAEKVGAAPGLTAAMVVVTGVLGAVMGPPLFSALGVKEALVRGVATGTAAHGIGTASLYRASPEAAAYSGLAMGLSGLITALITPALVSWLVAP